LTMSNHDDSWERLDTEFDHCLLDMKPYVLKHPDKKERQRCAIWIKKLCDPGACGSGLLGRKNRNVYARLLLQMLRRGVLDGPFSHKPEHGTLKTLPTYMSIYFDEPVSVKSQTGPPDWVTGELGAFGDDSWPIHLDDSSQTPRNRYCLYLSLHYYNTPVTLFISTQILTRKNGEIEELKSMYRAKQKQSEEMILKLERKVQSVQLESQVITESREKQIAELKKMADQSTDSLKNEWEKKLHAAVTEMEQEKFELQKKHTRNIQELLEETNVRLAKMEAEYNARAQSTQTVRDLEKRVKQQSLEVEKGNSLRQRVTQEKAQLEIHIAAISAELQEANRRSLSLTVLQKEKEDQKDFYEQNMGKLRAKYETDISHLQQEHTLSAAKASELIDELEKTVAHFRHQLQDNEHLRLTLLQDQEVKFQKDKDELQIQCEKKVLSIHSEAEKERADSKKKIGQLQDTLREAEKELEKTRESQREQMLQADLALEQFKKQVEASSEKAFAETKLQMEKVEEDLLRSKSLRENQAKEFSYQLDSLRQKYEQQMTELRMQHEQERTRLQQAHIAEKDSMVQERQREASSMERQARATLQQHQQLTQEWRKRDAQVISNLEAQVTSLREELQIANFEHKQQLAETASQLEEEKQKASVDKEEALERLRFEMVCSRKDVERKLHEEQEAALEKYVNITMTTTLILNCHIFFQVTAVRQQYEEKLKGLMSSELRHELEDIITSLKAQVQFYTIVL
uniref:Centrosomal protein 112 n=1 Tax=Neogobius melanostomus TaxID=47308 RepID=A0A8C6TNA8_9GOBI